MNSTMKIPSATFRGVLSIGLLLVATLPGSVQAKVKIAASLPDFASIAAAVGGEQVEVFAIAKANGNPHFVEVLPSYMIKVSRVDLYLKVGLALDQWADAIIEGSRNNHLQVIDCSGGVEVLDKPTGKVDASLGDVHPQGNPHYWLDPANGSIIADHILDALKALDPSHATDYTNRNIAFKAELTRRNSEWKKQLAFLQGKAIITYHSSWAYYAHALGCQVVGYVEPFPGIPPTAKHVQELVGIIKDKKVGLLIQEPYYPGKDPEFLAKQTGLKVQRFTPSCEGVTPSAYLDHFENMAKNLIPLEADLSRKGG
jgi:zinc/manganese transport system substrate-binding protein